MTKHIGSDVAEEISYAATARDPWTPYFATGMGEANSQCFGPDMHTTTLGPRLLTNRLSVQLGLVAHRVVCSPGLALLTLGGASPIAPWLIGIVLGFALGLGRKPCEASARLLTAVPEGLRVAPLGEGSERLVEWRSVGAIESWQLFNRTAYLRVHVIGAGQSGVIAIWQDSYEDEAARFLSMCAIHSTAARGARAAVTTVALRDSGQLRPVLKRFAVDVSYALVAAAAITRSWHYVLVAVLGYPPAYAIGSLLRSPLNSQAFKWGGSAYRETPVLGTFARSKPRKSISAWLKCLEECH